MVDQPLKKAPWWTQTGTAVAGDGTPLAFATGGPAGARAIICNNGLGVSTFFWDYVGAHFCKDHHVVVWDYRGHGGSGNPLDPRDLTITAMAEDMARVMDANEIEAGVLLGHSLGCQVVFEFYRLFPDRVLGLVPMLGAFGRAAETFLDPKVGPLIYNLVYKMGTRVPELANIGAQLALRSRLAWPFARITGLVHPDLARRSDMDPYLDHLSRLDMQVFLELARAAQEHDAEALLPQIEAPALVVAGERDLFTPRHLSLEMAHRMPAADLLEIPRGSHAALIEQPELINLRLEKWLAERVAAFEAGRRAQPGPEGEISPEPNKSETKSGDEAPAA